MFTKSERNGIRQGLEKRCSSLLIMVRKPHINSEYVEEGRLPQGPYLVGPRGPSRGHKINLTRRGHFDYGIKQLNQSGLRQKLEEKVFEDKIPILGICLEHNSSPNVVTKEKRMVLAGLTGRPWHSNVID